MNFTLIIVTLIIILTAVHGFKKGMTKEVSGLISWTVTLFVMSLVIMLYTSFHANESKNAVFTIIILAAVVIVYFIIKMFLKPMKLVAKLPVFKLLDQMLGGFIGIVEGFMIVWLMYVLNEGGILGEFGEMITADTARSQILSLIYEYNYLITIQR
mgnify:CR=1 FL=1